MCGKYYWITSIQFFYNSIINFLDLAVFSQKSTKNKKNPLKNIFNHIFNIFIKKKINDFFFHFFISLFNIYFLYYHAGYLQNIGGRYFQCQMYSFYRQRFPTWWWLSYYCIDNIARAIYRHKPLFCHVVMCRYISIPQLKG